MQTYSTEKMLVYAVFTTGNIGAGKDCRNSTKTPPTKKSRLQPSAPWIRGTADR